MDGLKPVAEHEGASGANITHCGSGIVNGDEHAIAERFDELARDRGIQAEIAYDGMGIVLR